MKGTEDEGEFEDDYDFLEATILHLPRIHREPPLPVHNMKDQTPCSDYLETSGIVFFARMLDKIRLNARGLLPDGYNLGFSDPTCFDARFCRFWDIDYDQLAARTLEGGTNEELLEWCFQDKKRPNSDQILVWNSFIIKRGWRDDGAPGLIVEKELNGCAHRDDIQTYVDLHDADEGRTPRFSSAQYQVHVV